MKFLFVFTIAALCFGQAKAPYKVPRTVDGKPDLQGIWVARNGAAFDVSEIAEGRMIPYLPEALEREKNADRVDPLNHCAMPGVPRISYMPFPFQIMQRPGFVAFLYEYLHNHRVILTTPREHVEGIDLFLGDSSGSWDGDTLVVDVVSLGSRTWLDSARHTHSDQLHVIERYTRTGDATMDYEATLEDAKTYSRPWKIRMTLHRMTDPTFELKEQECSEGDDGRAIQPLYRPYKKS